MVCLGPVSCVCWPALFFSHPAKGREFHGLEPLADVDSVGCLVGYFLL